MYSPLVTLLASQQIDAPKAFLLGSGGNSISITTDADTDILAVIAGVHQGDITNVEFDGDDLTKIDGGDTAFHERSEIWILRNPAAKTANLVLSTSGGSGPLLIAVKIKNAEAGSDPTEHANNDGDSGYSEIAITPTLPNGLILAGMYAEPVPSIDLGNSLSIIQGGNSYENAAAAYMRQVDAAAFTHGWDNSYGARWASVAVVFYPPGDSTDVNDSRGGRITGKDTANSTRSARITGKDTSNSSRSARITGKDTANSSRSARITGTDTANSNRSVRITGTDTANSNRGARITGTDTANSSRGVRITGTDTASNSRSARITGAEGADSARGGHITGQDTANASRGAKITGQDTSTSFRGARITGQDVATSNRSARITGVDTATSNRSARITGQDTANSARSARVTGITLLEELQDDFNDDSLDATKWAGYGSGVDETDSTLQISSSLGGEYTGISSVDEWDLRDSYAFVKLVDAGDQSIPSFECYPLHLSLENNDNHVEFVVRGGNITAGQIVGGGAYEALWTVAYNSSVHVFLRIREDSGTLYFEYSDDAVSWTVAFSEATPFDVSHVRAGILIGTWQAEATTTTAIFDNFNVPPTQANDSRSARISGQDSTTDFRGGRIAGQDTSTSARNARISGQDTAVNSRSARIAGQDSTSDIRGARVRGQDTTFASRGARISGSETSSDSRGARITGADSATNSRGARITGKDTSIAVRGARISGSESSSSVRGARITGVHRPPYTPSGDPYTPSVSPYEKSASPYTKNPSPYEKKVSPFSQW